MLRCLESVRGNAAVRAFCVARRVASRRPRARRRPSRPNSTSQIPAIDTTYQLFGTTVYGLTLLTIGLGVCVLGMVFGLAMFTTGQARCPPTRACSTSRTSSTRPARPTCSSRAGC